MRLIIVEGYYDPTDLDNPVKYKFNNKITVPTNYGWFSNKHLTIKQNQVKKLDSNTINFSTIQYEDANYFEYFTDYVSSCYFDLADSYDYYEMYIDYQPDLDSTRRNLDSASNEEELMSGEYLFFYVMAQMGFLYTFLYLNFGIFINHYNKQALNHTIINELYRAYSIRDPEDEKKYASQNNIGRNHMRRVALANSRRVPNRNQSVYRENDPLVNQQMHPIHGNFYQNDTRRMSRAQPQNLHHHRNHENHLMYDGGDEMQNLERSRTLKEAETYLIKNFELITTTTIYFIVYFAEIEETIKA